MSTAARSDQVARAPGTESSRTSARARRRCSSGRPCTRRRGSTRIRRRDAGPPPAPPPPPPPPQPQKKKKKKPADSGIGHRCVDPAALAAALHTDESTEDRDRGLKAATADVGHLDRQRHRRSVALPVQA